MDIKDARVVVIGGAGFVGSHTIERLLNEDVSEVLVLDNFIRGCKQNLQLCLSDRRLKIVDIPTDILHTDTLDACIKGADGVIHLAALWLTQSQAYPRSSFEVNVIGTYNVFESCLKNNIKRVVFASSASVYGNAISKPMTEDHPLGNTTVYGATKISGEAIGYALLRSHRLPLVGLRYFNIYGPRQDSRGAYNSVIVKMLDAAEKNVPLTIYGDGTQSYDFISVRDVARANVCALKAEHAEGFFNVCTGVSTSINEVADTIRRVTGSTSTVEYASQAVSFVTDRVGCPKKALERLSFQYTLGFQQGMIDFCEWRQQNASSEEQRPAPPGSGCHFETMVR